MLRKSKARIKQSRRENLKFLKQYTLAFLFHNTCFWCDCPFMSGKCFLFTKFSYFLRDRFVYNEDNSAYNCIVVCWLRFDFVMYICNWYFNVVIIENATESFKLVYSHSLFFLFRVYSFVVAQSRLWQISFKKLRRRRRKEERIGKKVITYGQGVLQG